LISYLHLEAINSSGQILPHCYNRFEFMDSVFYSCPQDFIAQGWTWTGASTIPYSMIGITTRKSTLWTTYHRTGYGKPNRLASFQQKAVVANFRGNECQQLAEKRSPRIPFQRLLWRKQTLRLEILAAVTDPMDFPCQGRSPRANLWT